MNRGRKANQMPGITVGDETAGSHERNKEMIREEFGKTFEKRLPEPAALEYITSLVRESGRGLSEEQAQALHKKMLMEDNQERDAAGKPVDWLWKTIDELKMYKAPGPDGIPNEFYYLLNDNKDLHALLKGVYKEAMVSGCLPASMRSTYYRLLYKKAIILNSK